MTNSQTIGPTARAAAGRALLVVLAAASILARPPGALAVSRSCGADALGNTASVLCAPTSGPCDATSVTVSEPIEVTTGGCTFDLGGRTLTLQRTFEMIGTGFVTIQNVGNVTITATAKLKARGDFVRPEGKIIEGGTITIISSGSITHGGRIDVTGDSAGRIVLTAAGNVTTQGGSDLQGIGNSTSVDDGARFADGGTLEITSTGGAISIGGPIVMTGHSAAQGGIVIMQAARDLDVEQPIDASGGANGGGTVDLSAGDDITITHPISVDSVGGGGDGGDIEIAAGEDVLGGVIAGGTLAMDGGSVNMRASQADSWGGDGGGLMASSHGPLLIGPLAPIRANAGLNFSGDGGTVTLRSGDDNVDAVAATDGDMSLQGLISAKSGGVGGVGGALAVNAGRNLSVSGSVDLGGKSGGGSVQGAVGGATTLTSAITADGTNATALGGAFSFRSCNLTVSSTGRIQVPGASGGSIALVARNHMTIDPGSQVKSTGTGATVALTTRSFGICSNDSTKHCRTNAECTVGCTSGTCMGINPDTGGTVAQFDPAPTFAENASLPSCL